MNEVKLNSNSDQGTLTVGGRVALPQLSFNPPCVLLTVLDVR